MFRALLIQSPAQIQRLQRIIAEAPALPALGGATEGQPGRTGPPGAGAQGAAVGGGA